LKAVQVQVQELRVHQELMVVLVGQELSLLYTKVDTFSYICHKGYILNDIEFQERQENFYII
jgi:hypothetical protein